MKAWVLGNPVSSSSRTKPVPVPSGANVLVRIDAVRSAPPISRSSIAGRRRRSWRHAVQQEFHTRHEYMALWWRSAPGVDEYKIGQRITVEIHAGCGQCKRCREGMYTFVPQLRPQLRRRRQGPSRQRLHHRRGFANTRSITSTRWSPSPKHVGRGSNAVYPYPHVRAGPNLGGLVAARGVVVPGAGPIGLLGVPWRRRWSSR